MSIRPSGLWISVSQEILSKIEQLSSWYVQQVKFDYPFSKAVQTHNVAMASSIAHFVVSMGSNGRIVSHGSISEAIAKDGKLAAEMAKEQEVLAKDAQVVDTPEEPKAKSDGKLVMSEEIAVGHVSWPACWFLPPYILGTLLILRYSQALLDRLGGELSYNVLGRVLGSDGVDGLRQHRANLVPWVLGISI